MGQSGESRGPKEDDVHAKDSISHMLAASSRLRGSVDVASELASVDDASRETLFVHHR